jgi:multidrug resistance efflux pump
MAYSLKPVLVASRQAAQYVGRALRGAVRSFRFWLLFLLAVIVVIIAYYVVADRRAPLTTDAYIQAYVIQVAPQVGGQVVRVYVREGDRVKKGNVLFELDARPFEHKIALLEAKLVEATQQVKRLDAEVKATEEEHKRVQAEAQYAREVHDQELAIYKKESTTKRKWLDAKQKHEASVAAVARSAQLVRQA